MPSIRKTSEGIIITSGGLRFFGLILGIIGTLITGVIGAVRFMGLTVPTRAEYTAHLVADSAVHREQRVHAAFTDSVLARAVRDNHATSCVIAKFPQSLCADIAPEPRP